MSDKSVKIVDPLLDSPNSNKIDMPKYWYRELCAAPGMTGRQLMESPQYRPGAFSYMNDSKFTPISMANFESYFILSDDETFIYAINSDKPELMSLGYVFLNADIERKPKLGMVPVMRLLLRDSVVKGYKQPNGLRIRQTYSRAGIATLWYLAYVENFGGIVSDFSHLEGGKTLWRSFVNKAADRGLKISTVDTLSGEWASVGPETPDEDIWSRDDTKKHIAIVLEKP